MSLRWGGKLYHRSAAAQYCQAIWPRVGRRKDFDLAMGVERGDSAPQLGRTGLKKKVLLLVTMYIQACSIPALSNS